MIALTVLAVYLLVGAAGVAGSVLARPAGARIRTRDDAAFLLTWPLWAVLAAFWLADRRLAAPEPRRT